MGPSFQCYIPNIVEIGPEVPDKKILTSFYAPNFKNLKKKVESIFVSACPCVRPSEKK